MKQLNNAEVADWRYGDLQGEAALRTDIIRECMCLMGNLIDGRLPDAVGLMWRLALLHRAADDSATKPA